MTAKPRPPCKDCGINPRYRNHSQCLVCMRPANAAKQQRYRERSIKAGLCLICFKATPENPNHRHCDACLAIHNKRTRDYKARIKVLCFNAYGGCRCVCCGETQITFLSIDHVHNNGAEHRRTLGKHRGAGGGHSFYLHLKKNNWPPGYQVLCFNCQWGKQICGVCPHQQNKSTSGGNCER